MHWDLLQVLCAIAPVGASQQGCLKLTDRGYQTSRLSLLRRQGLWQTPTNSSSLISTFAIWIAKACTSYWLIATSRDSLGTYWQHVQHWPKPLGIIKSRRGKVALSQDAILVTIIAPCIYTPLVRTRIKWLDLSRVMWVRAACRNMCSTFTYYSKSYLHCKKSFHCKYQHTGAVLVHFLSKLWRLSLPVLGCGLTTTRTVGDIRLQIHLLFI